MGGAHSHALALALPRGGTGVRLLRLSPIWGRTLSIDVDAFRGQIEFLRDEGFTVLTLSDALQRLDAGDLDTPTAVLTIDDGYDSFRTGAMPLLQEFGMPATLFINTAGIGRRGMLDWEDLTRLVEQGMEIGNHTVSHDYFLDLTDAERQQEFATEAAAAQQTFVANMGVAPTACEPVRPAPLSHGWSIRHSGRLHTQGSHAGPASGRHRSRLPRSVRHRPGDRTAVQGELFRLRRASLQSARRHLHRHTVHAHRPISVRFRLALVQPRLDSASTYRSVTLRGQPTSWDRNLALPDGI